MKRKKYENSNHGKSEEILTLTEGACVWKFTSHSLTIVCITECKIAEPRVQMFAHSKHASVLAIKRITVRARMRR